MGVIRMGVILGVDMPYQPHNCVVLLLILSSFFLLSDSFMLFICA